MKPQYITAKWTFKIVSLSFEVTSKVCNEIFTFITKKVVENMQSLRHGISPRRRQRMDFDRMKSNFF